ncbi:isochorismatase family protein [bacterium]|nr:isochorismatase family protein [bacterium]
MGAYVTGENLQDKTGQWLEIIARFNVHKMELNPHRSALLVIDMQNYFIEPSGHLYLQGGNTIVPNIKQLIERFRDSGIPVIYTRHGHHPDRLDVGFMGWWWGDMIREGSPESEIFKEITPLPGEKVIHKHRYSAFYNTDLETILRCGKVEDLVITGVMTNLCCETTARAAYMRDYRVFFLADATAAATEEMHIASLTNLGFGFAYITTTADILDMMNK